MAALSQNHQLADALSVGLLPQPDSTRRMVLALTPVCREIERHEAPEARSEAIFSTSAITRGRPRRLPLVLAAARPLRTLSRVNSRSNSAMLAKMPNTRRPLGVDVSTPSWRLINSIPRARNSSSALTSCRRLRANLSYRYTTTASTRRFRQSARSLSNAGRFSREPLIPLSTYSFVMVNPRRWQ